MSPLATLVMLANKFNRKIPDAIPAHYVKYCLDNHRHARKMAMPTQKQKPTKRYEAIKHKPVPNVIYL
jgi:hypothetical protein